jgi:hypothetical protein
VATAVTSLSLPSGPNYLTFANPTVAVSGISAANQRVQVGCTLTIGSNTQAPMTVAARVCSASSAAICRQHTEPSVQRSL